MNQALLIFSQLNLVQHDGKWWKLRYEDCVALIFHLWKTSFENQHAKSKSDIYKYGANGNLEKKKEEYDCAVLVFRVNKSCLSSLKMKILTFVPQKEKEAKMNSENILEWLSLSMTSGADSWLVRFRSTPVTDRSHCGNKHNVEWEENHHCSARFFRLREKIEIRCISTLHKRKKILLRQSFQVERVNLFWN